MKNTVAYRFGINIVHVTCRLIERFFWIHHIASTNRISHGQYSSTEIIIIKYVRFVGKPVVYYLKYYDWSLITNILLSISQNKKPIHFGCIIIFYYFDVSNFGNSSTFYVMYFNDRIIDEL